MGATKRMSNGESKSIGPHPSNIRVCGLYMPQAAIEKRLQPQTNDAQEKSQAEAREDSIRLQGITWLDTVRRALQLPIRTFTTASVYFHRFRLVHPTIECSWADAAAASLLTSCKNEDTLKKSRDILAAAYNLKQPLGHEQLSSDDPIFDQPSKSVIALERLVLESSGFDFRTRAPHEALIKLGKALPQNDSPDTREVARVAWTILTDLHRTFAPLKQTSTTMALACLELSAHLQAAAAENGTSRALNHLQTSDPTNWYTTREEVMETLLDLLDLYTHHTTSTILGTKYSLDAFLRIRLALNQECSDTNLQRHTVARPRIDTQSNDVTIHVTNGHPTPVSPPQVAGRQTPNGIIMLTHPPIEGGTLRFMLDPQMAIDERAQVNRFFVDEWEEYEEEIEVQLPQRPRSRDRDGRSRDHSSRAVSRDREERNSDRESARGAVDRPRERELREREKEIERERARLRQRERERDRRFEERRYDGPSRSRRYDDDHDHDRDQNRDRGRRYGERPFDDDHRRSRR